jgi:threonine aldolase
MLSFRYDAPELSAIEIAQEISKISRKRSISFDSYTNGGEVNIFEEKIAEIIGKERAVFMPTGTLANHLAIRALARSKSRILVQKTGHIYNDMGDALSKLSGFNLIALGNDSPQYNLQDAKKAYLDSQQSRVKTQIGALVIENPVRRCHGALFDYHEIVQITQWAKEKGIGTHLDGARIFIASSYSGISVKDYASYFDTVYVSLYKYFGTPSGAVLLGDSSLLDDIYHERRMFGGSLNQSWIFAALALENLASFDEEFSEAIDISERFIKLLSNSSEFEIIRIPNGSNIFIMQIKNSIQKSYSAGLFEEVLRKKQILLPQPEDGKYYLRVNTSLIGHKPEKLASEFISSLRQIR